MRSPVSLDVIRDRNALFRLTDDGNVDNVYTVRILNKTEHPQRFVLEARGASPLTLIAKQTEYQGAVGSGVFPPIAGAASRLRTLGPETIVITLRSLDDPRVVTETDARFLAPTR